jgi:hypothetical protein
MGFDEMAGLPTSSQSPDCTASPEAEATVFSEDFLLKRGVSVDYNGELDLRRTSTASTNNEAG